MSSARQRQLRQERQRVDRRRSARETVAGETQRQQAAAAIRHDYTRQRRRHIAAYVLFALAVLIAVTHLLEHWGVFQLMAPTLQDLLLGWPMAGVLGIAGAIVHGK